MNDTQNNPTLSAPAEAPTDQAAPERYGNRRVPKMYAEINALRRLIAAEGTPAVQDAWGKIEEHIDYAYQRIASAAPSAPAEVDPPDVRCNKCGWLGYDDDLVGSIDSEDGEPSKPCPNCGTDAHLMDVDAPAEDEVLVGGETRTLAVTAVWKPCIHGGGWWIAKNADGGDVLLSSDTPQAATTLTARQATIARLTADLAAPSAPAEVGGLVERLRAVEEDPNTIYRDSNFHHICEEAATTLTALQAENERLRKALDAADGNGIWRFWHGEAKKYMDRSHALQARAEKAEAERDEARDALSACVQFADGVSDAADIDMDETVLMVRVMPEGREVGRKSWAQVQADARAILARIDQSNEAGE